MIGVNSLKNRFNEYIRTPINKQNADEISFLLCGIIADLILGKEYFTRNIEIRTFTTNILDEEYKDYLFASRTALYARIIKDLKVSILNDPDEFVKRASNIKQFIEERKSKGDTQLEMTQNKEEAKKRRNKRVDPIDEWRKIINPK